MSGKRVLVVGGVAAGASCAARVRRLDESAEVVVFERGPHVSFASCGLPYHVGGVIPEEDDLLLVGPETFRDRYAIDVRVNHEVVAIDRQRREIEVRDRATNTLHRERYDALVLATGARPFRPPIPGIDAEGVFELRTVPDSRRIREWIDARGARRAVIAGAGLIGPELAEKRVERGLEVDVVDLQDQVLGHLDPEMAALVADHLRAHGVRLHLGRAVKSIDPGPDGLTVRTSAGERLAADLVVLATGVRPESGLAREAGLELGALGGVKVDAQMRTSDPHIWAVGDVVEDPCYVTGRWLLVPLAGPASRQGRVAADAICGRSARYRGVQGTAVIGLFGLTAASTGTCERKLPPEVAARARSVWLHPNDHVGWFPGASPIHLKLVFDPDGRVLGAQAVGRSGVERRIDVVATAMQLGGTVYDLEEAELCYAPQFGAARDPVNLAGMTAANHLRGDLPLARWQDLHRDGEALLVDVREPHEYAAGHVPDAVNVPLSRLRDELDRLPRDQELWLYCQSGKRSYDAARALTQRGFRVRSLSGGMETWRQLQLV